MRLLLLSNSANRGEGFLEYPKNEISGFLGNTVKNVLFIPFAAVTFSYNEYEMLVADKFETMGYQLQSIHRFKNYSKAIKNADAIIVGGGNTFILLNTLQQTGLLKLIRKKILSGTPYVGWSAGANITCPTIRTTNDMPVIQMKTLNALNLVPFQINPHYTDDIPKGFAGETRDMRIREFTEINKNIYVIGLREGTMLKITDNKIKLIGNKKARIFYSDKNPEEYQNTDDINFLLKG